MRLINWHILSRLDNFQNGTIAFASHGIMGVSECKARLEMKHFVEPQLWQSVRNSSENQIVLSPALTINALEYVAFRLVNPYEESNEMKAKRRILCIATRDMVKANLSKQNAGDVTHTRVHGKAKLKAGAVLPKDAILVGAKASYRACF